MKRVTIILSDGFEEIEAISVIDILRRATVSVEVLAVGDVNVTGGHGITMLADDVFDYYGALDFDAIIFPRKYSDLPKPNRQALSKNKS